MLEIEKMAELATTTGYCSLGFLLGTSVAKRDRPYRLLLAARGSWARALRKILDSRAGRKTRSPKNTSFRQGDSFAKINSKRTLNGIGEIPRPRQEAANLPPAAFLGARAADPPYIPPLAPKLAEADLLPHDPARRRADDAERSRRVAWGANAGPQCRPACATFSQIHYRRRSRGRSREIRRRSHSGAQRRGENGTVPLRRGSGARKRRGHTRRDCRAQPGRSDAMCP